MFSGIVCSQRVIGKEEGCAHWQQKSSQSHHFIRANPGANISLVAMAQIAGVSPNHFVLLFTEATGLTPHQYVLRQELRAPKSI